MGPSSASLPLLNPSYSATSQFDHAGVGNFLVSRDHMVNNHSGHPLFPAQLGPVSLSLSSHYNVDPRLAAGTPRAVPVSPTEPFTGYAAVLKTSRFLRPAQHMLEEICDVGGVGRVHESVSDLTLDGPNEKDGGVVSGPGEQGRTKSRLISMLDEVHRRYKQYCQQIHYVITSFESVAGLSNAAPYTSLAIKSMSKHFRCLKEAISDQLRFTDNAANKDGRSKEGGIHGFGTISGGVCYQGMAHGSGGIGQANVWRPQRGLPERAVAVLKAWLFEHFLHPYPTDTDKHMLAKQTGLSRNQVSNWFINARVRLWKPLVEEIHSLEMRQTRKVSEVDSSHSAKQHSLLASSSNEPNTSKQLMQNIVSEKNQVPPLKRFRNEFSELSNHMEEPSGMCFDEFPSNHRLGAGVGITNAGGGNGISLTLGLHQNNGICISEPLPLSVARRFGLEETSASYVMGGFDVQDRHFGKDIEGQLLHDFVG